MKISFRRLFRKRNSSSDSHLFKQDLPADATFFKATGKNEAGTIVQKKDSPEEEYTVQPKSTLHQGLAQPFIPPLDGRGKGLPTHSNAFFSKRMGYDFSTVRIHTGQEASSSAKSLGARAYTIGTNIVFNEGEYQPDSHSGKKLLAHELTHVIQQSKSASGKVQRDLSAYNKAQIDTVQTYDPMGAGSSTFYETSAEAAGIRAALDQLIKDDKVKEIKSGTGNKSWFAANHKKNVTLAEIESAFSAAGYGEAKKMAKALYDIHSEYLYSNNKIVTYTMFGPTTHTSKNKLHRETSRAMTEYEISQAKRVFKSAINYSKVTIEENSNVFAAFGYARTVGNTIYFPDDSYRNMAFMIHELTHVWQYQTTGWTYAPKALIAQAREGYNYTPEGKTPDEALRDARAAGKTLYDFNKEQQGDILSDYFRRLQKGVDVSAYQPFINDI